MIHFYIYHPKSWMQVWHTLLSVLEHSLRETKYCPLEQELLKKSWKARKFPRTRLRLPNIQGNIYMTQTHCISRLVLHKSGQFYKILSNYGQSCTNLGSSAQIWVVLLLPPCFRGDTFVWLLLLARLTPFQGSAEQSSDLFLQRHQY